MDVTPFPNDSLQITAPATFAGAPSNPRLVLASWPKRFIGAIVDWFPMAILSAIGMWSGVVWLYYVLGFVAGVWGLFDIGYLGGATGVSLGRRIAGTKLVREETLQPIGPGPGIGRYFLHIIDAAICCVGFLFPLWTTKKQTIADIIMRTIVIEDAPSRY